MLLLCTMAAEATARAVLRVQAAQTITTAEGLHLPCMADLGLMPVVFRSPYRIAARHAGLCGPLALLAVGLLALGLLGWLNPTPPRVVVLATGADQSAYAEFGQRYRKALAEQGIEVRLLPSEGSLANLQLLREGRADLLLCRAVRRC